MPSPRAKLPLLLISPPPLVRAALHVLTFLFLLPFLSLAAPIAFDIPSQPAADALLAFSQQARVDVLFPSDDLRQVQSTGLYGNLEPDAALTRLLQHTGFHARRTSPDTFIVARSAAPTGLIKGRLLTPESAPAAEVEISIPELGATTLSNRDGEFDLSNLPPGTYRLLIRSDSHRPLEVANVVVEPRRVSNIETHTLSSADGIVQLAPRIVEGKFYRRWRDRSEEDFQPQRAAGNLDLPRSANDALPYTIYDRQQIARSGAVNLNGFLQRYVLDGNATEPPLEQSNHDLFRSGSSNLPLRGFASDETIILVNGRRMPEILVVDERTPPPDVNFIPVSLVDRVEVLPVSASALYSGNPVGGVINIVLRPTVTRTEVTTTYTNALADYDAPQFTASLQHGESLLQDKLRVRFSATITESTPPVESELGYIRRHSAARTTPAELLYRATPNLLSADGSALFGPGTSSFTSVAPGSEAANHLAAFAGRAGVRNTDLFNLPQGLANSFESSDFVYGRRQRGRSYFASAIYDASEWLQFGLDAIYSRSVVHRGADVFRGTLALPADSPLNPFAQDVIVTLNETAPALGPHYGEARVDFYSLVAGVLAKLPRDWRVSLDAQYGHSLTRYRGVQGTDADAWQRLVDTGRYNPLRDTQLHAPPDAFYDDVIVFYGAKDRFVTLGDYQTFDTAVRVTNQSIPLPTGSGAVNFGADYRVNQLASHTSELRNGRGELVEPATRFTGRTVERISVFGELLAPVVAPHVLPSWIREIQSDLAARYVVSDSAQESNLAPTAGLKIDFAAGFSLRGSVSTSNRFPTPFMSRRVSTGAGPGGGEVELANIRDPQFGGEEYGVNSSVAQNPNLRSEANITRTVGFLVQRGEVHRFRFSADFSDTRKADELFTLNAQSAVNLEADFPDRVRRSPVTGRIEHVLTGPINLAERHSQSWSTAADYAWTESFGGRLDLYTRWSYFPRYDTKTFPDSPTVDQIRHPDGTNVSLLEHRVNFGGSWSRRHIGFGVDGHYYHSRRLEPRLWSAQHRRTIDPYLQLDAYVQADLTKWIPWPNPRFGLRGQLRVNNLFDAAPPYYAADSIRAGVQPYTDWRRQTYAFTLQATF